MKSIADMPVTAFNALAALNIYFFADLDYTSVRTSRQRRRYLRILHDHGYLSGCPDVENAGDEVADLYSETLEAHVANEMPAGWEPTHDHWGAKCFAYRPGWVAPKHNSLFAGDTSARYMTFGKASDLQAYTHRSIAEIEEATSQAATEHEEACACHYDDV